jgi:threonine dehydrogenase-like Zn-dependent dehydrogenase
VGLESHRANKEWLDAGKDPYREKDSGLIGWKRMKNGILLQGTWAEYIAVPEFYVTKIPEDLFYKLPGSLWEPFGNGMRIFQTIKPYLDLNKKIIISGCGYQGIQIMLILKYYYGVSNIYATDVSEEKVNFVKENITKNAYLPWNLPKEEYDLWLEMSGSEKAIIQAFQMVKKTLLLFGLPSKEIKLEDEDVSSFIFNYGNKMINGIHVISAFGRFKEDWDLGEEVIQKISEKFDFSKIFTLYGALNNLPKLYHQSFFKNPPPGFFKAVFNEFEDDS